jgi:hypothetical protein
MSGTVEESVVGLACLSPRNFFSKRIRGLKFIERLAEEVTVELA